MLNDAVDRTEYHQVFLIGTTLKMASGDHRWDERRSKTTDVIMSPKRQCTYYNRAIE
jgi:hypothetical protein